MKKVFGSLLRSQLPKDHLKNFKHLKEKPPWLERKLIFIGVSEQSLNGFN